MMFKAIIDKAAKLFDEDTALHAAILFVVAITLLALLAWFLVFSGIAVDAAPIYEGF